MHFNVPAHDVLRVASAIRHERYEYGLKPTSRPPLKLPRRFGMEARFHLPPDLGPSQLGVQWAAVVGVRDTETLSLMKLAGATHQVRNIESGPTTGVRVALGTGNGTVPGSVNPGIDLTNPAKPYPATNRAFRVVTLIDADAGTGKSWLFTPRKAWTPRSWQFDFQMTAVGFGLAMVSGGGTLRASIDWFYIYEPKLRRWWSEWIIRLREIMAKWALA